MYKVILCNVKICPDFYVKSVSATVKSQGINVHTHMLLFQKSNCCSTYRKWKFISKFDLECKNINKQIDNLPVCQSHYSGTLIIVQVKGYKRLHTLPLPQCLYIIFYYMHTKNVVHISKCFRVRLNPFFSSIYTSRNWKIVNK